MSKLNRLEILSSKIKKDYDTHKRYKIQGPGKDIVYLVKTKEQIYSILLDKKQYTITISDLRKKMGIKLAMIVKKWISNEGLVVAIFKADQSYALASGYNMNLWVNDWLNRINHSSYFELKWLLEAHTNEKSNIQYDASKVLSKTAKSRFSKSINNLLRVWLHSRVLELHNTIMCYTDTEIVNIMLDEGEYVYLTNKAKGEGVVFSGSSVVFNRANEYRKLYPKVTKVLEGR